MASVLIVDDVQESRQSLGRFLEAAGHEVRGVCDGREALAAVLAKLPDVVVLDLFMPEMDGPSFLEVVRSYLRLQSLPVVVLTGMPDSPMVDRARALKVNAILVKSKAEPHDVLHAVEEAAFHVPGA
jgi:CheY-like chemotaxis protein